MMTETTLSFTVYLIHELAEAWEMLPSKVFHVLKRTGCIDNYLLPHYEVLHTLGTKYLIEDIDEYVEGRGGK